MELTEYLRMLRRRAWIPLLLVVVTVISTGAIVYLSKPEYTATASVVAKAPTAASTSALSFPDVVASNTLALRVRRELKLTIPASTLASTVKSSSKQNNLYTVSYTDPSADLAAAIANAYANDAAAEYQHLGGPAVSIVKATQGDLTTFRSSYAAAVQALIDFRQKHPDVAAAVDVQMSVVGGTFPIGSDGKPVVKAPPSVDPVVAAQYLTLKLNEQAAAQAYADFNTDVSKARIDEINSGQSFEASVVDQAIAKPDTVTRFLKVLYGGLLALVLGVGIALAVEYLDNSVREPEEVEQLVGAPVIAMIPRATARTLRPASGASA